MRRWLQAALAQRLGIAANLEFLTPSQFVWRLLRAAEPALPEQSPWDPERLRWRLFALFGEDAELPDAVDAHRAAIAATAGGALALAHALPARSIIQAYRRMQLERLGSRAARLTGKRNSVGACSAKTCGRVRT